MNVHSDGSQGDGSSWDPSLSADGRVVAFESYATNLVDGDANVQFDVFVHDLDAEPSVLPGDVDGDGDIDKTDLSQISRSRNQPASGPDDPYDVNGDGMITMADVLACIPLCTRPGCATE